MRQLILSAAIVATLSACTWVKMAPGGAEVRVVRADQPVSGCQLKGEIAVSVKNSVGFYERNDLKVRDELETLARNEAPTLAADTIQPKGEPVDGEQRFQAYRCGAAPVSRTTPVARDPADGTVETFPIED